MNSKPQLVYPSRVSPGCRLGCRVPDSGPAGARHNRAQNWSVNGSLVAPLAVTTLGTPQIDTARLLRGICVRFEDQGLLDFLGASPGQ